MRSRNFDGMVCSIASVMGAMGDRWGLLVMRDILFGLRRYDEFQQSSGVTNTTLADRLKTLESNGLIKRRLYQSRPARYEYLPTERGRDLTLVMQALIQVGDKWSVMDGEGAPMNLVNRHTGQPTSLSRVETESGASVKVEDLVAVPGPGADDTMRWRLETAGARRRS